MANVVVIGAGYWGPNLIRNLDALPSRPLYGVCDLREGRLALMRRRYPYIRTAVDYREFLEDAAVDAVVVATPAATHFDLVRDALLCHKHVLVEKPLSLSSEECRQLLRLADTNGCVLMVGHTFEYSPAVLKLKELVHSGELGQIYYIYSNRLNLGRVRRDVNALWNLAPHDVSIILSLLGEEPCHIIARGYSFIQPNIEDVVFTVLDFPCGAGASVHVSWLAPNKVRSMTIVGSEKMVVYDDTSPEQKVLIYDKGISCNSTYRDGLSFDSFGEFQLLLRTGDIYVPHLEASEPLRNECAHFIACIEDGVACRTDGMNGLKVVKILEAAQKSLLNGGEPVEIEPEGIQGR